MKLENFTYKDSYKQIKSNTDNQKDNSKFNESNKCEFYNNGFLINKSEYLNNKELVKEFNELFFLGTDPIIDANRRKISI